MRSLHKLWKDKPHGYSYRISWYENMDLSVRPIRLTIETPSGRHHIWPETYEIAQAHWTSFIEAHRT